MSNKRLLVLANIAKRMQLNEKLRYLQSIKNFLILEELVNNRKELEKFIKNIQIGRIRYQFGQDYIYKTDIYNILKIMEYKNLCSI